MEEMEKRIINFFGYHEVLAEINNIKFWAILDRDNNNIGYVEYDEASKVYHLRINAPGIWVDTKRHKGSKKIKCKYEFGFKYKGKAKIYPK